MQSLNSTESTRFAMPALPGDNRSPEIRYLNDVQDVVRAASILDILLERDFAWSRATEHDREQGILTFRFSEKSIDDLRFAVRDILYRARSLDARAYLFDKEEGE